MNRRIEADKYLVVEQKGWRVVVLGLSLAIIFSLTFKAVFSPRRIQYEIERVLSAADPRITTLAEGAHLSLSDGMLPRLAIVIDKLKIHSDNPCINQVNANIENLEMPIAFLSLLNRNLIFKRIEVGLLNINMNAKRLECASQESLETFSSGDKVEGRDGIINKNTGTLSEKKSIVSQTQSIDSSQNIQDPDSKEHQNKGVKDKRVLESPPLVQTMSLESKLLRHIIFHKVNLQLLEYPQFKWILKDIDVHLPSNENEKTIIEGLISLSSNSTIDSSSLSFQGINAKVETQIDHQSIETKVHGAWREGRIDIEGYWDTKTHNFNWSGTFKQIPWGQIIVLAKAFGKNEPLPVSSQAWVTTKVQWNHSSEKPEHIELVDTQIEGEFGDFLLGKVLVDRSADENNWVISPYSVLMKEINVDILSKMLGWEGRYSAFNKFGIFDGEAQYVDNQLESLEGSLKNIKIIFSGKGRNQIQSINNVKLQVKGRVNEWLGTLKEIDLEGGHWDGEVNIGVDQSTKTVRLDAQFSKLKLNPDIEEMMTMKGSLSPLEGKLKVDFVDGKIINLQGLLKVDQAIVNDFNLEKAKVEFEGDSTRVNGKVNVQDFTASKSKLEYWPQKIPDELDNLKIKNVSGNFTQSISGIEIKELQGQLPDFKTRFIFDASANSMEQIQGQLHIKGDRKFNQTFYLSGTRRSPQWTVEETK